MHDYSTAVELVRLAKEESELLAVSPDPRLAVLGRTNALIFGVLRAFLDVTPETEYNSQVQAILDKDAAANGEAPSAPVDTVTPADNSGATV